MRASETGDEPLLMARRLEGVPVIKDSYRFRGGTYALENLAPAPDLFILDDGFQHRRLYRDIDILLLNASIDLREEKLLPMGMLREPMSQIERADYIIITKVYADIPDDLLEVIKKYNPDAPRFMGEHRPSHLMNIHTGERIDLDMLDELDVLAFSGIAEPDYFSILLDNYGARVRGHSAFRDHYRYTQSDIDLVEYDASRLGAEWIITTGKDVMRLEGLDIPQNTLSLEIDFTIDNDFYDAIFADLRSDIGADSKEGEE